jgi:spore germination cell wall hydrolase CwlJ-like protein
MTWLHSRSLGQRSVLALGLILLAVLAYLILTSMSSRAAASDTVPVLSAKAAALVDATASGESGAKVGEEALLINASLPFSKSPVQAAQAFVLPSGESLEQRRALLCLTQAVYYEAGFEPGEGRRAVAQVILNRMRHPAFPKSVCGVVYQHNSTPVCQFTFVCDGSLNRRPAAGAWNEAEKVARAALGGYVEQSVGGATHYHADYVAPRWAPLLTKITKLGAHIFYRWPGAWGQRSAFTGRYAGERFDPDSLRPAILPTGPDSADAGAVAAGPITDGTVLKRAPNDVGGLLDTSKGWTLNIPMPSEASSATRAIAERQAGATAVAAQNEPAAETRVIASR